MKDSFVGKVRKVLEKPVPPAHIQQRQYHVVVPWHERLWHAIRPPAAVPQRRRPMNTRQRRMLLAAAAVVVLLASAWGIYDYITSAPARAQAKFDAGAAQMARSQFEAAIVSFTESLAIKETPEAHLERGNAYKNLRQGGKAVADWNQAIQLDANDTAAYTARGTFYQASGDTAKALADLEQSLRLTPTVDGFFQRGQLYATLGQYDKALRDYDQAIAERRDAPYVYLARSAAKKALGDEEGSQRDAARAAELQHSK